MTSKEIEGILEKTGFPYKYDHFTQKEMKEIELPVVVWRVPGTDNFFADGVTYKEIKKMNIELYTDNVDWEAGEVMEKILEEYGIPWKRTGPEWLNTESMWERLYEMEV